MPVTMETFERIALADPEGQWELHRGRLRPKPGGTFAHNETVSRLAAQLIVQRDATRYGLRLNQGYLNRTDENAYRPDLFVVPLGLPNQAWDIDAGLEAYDAPMPLVVEVWEPPTDDYDVDAKLPEYRRRGDREIWRVHPFEQTLTVWRRRSGGGYDESVHRSGVVRPVALPEVAVDPDALFAR